MASSRLLLEVKQKKTGKVNRKLERKERVEGRRKGKKKFFYFCLDSGRVSQSIL